jgi:hypothetical protein
MKKIYQSLILAMVAAVPFIFAACDDDNGTNPTLSVPDSFTLNRPSFAANNVYDLPKSDAIVLTTSQPDYGGWPAAVTYAVQVSLDAANAEGWKELATTSTSTVIKVPGEEVNAAVLELYRAANEDADPEGTVPLYVRLRAFLADTGKDFGQVFSNAVTLNVLSYDAPSEASLPTALYVCGGSIADAWSTWKPLAQVYGKEGRFYTMVYNGADGFKWGTRPEEWLGYDAISEFDNQADGLTITRASDDNIVFDKAGWYVLLITSKIVGSDVKYTLTVADGKAGVRGNAVGDWDNDHLLTAPAGKDGKWTFSDFTGSGELRAYIIVPGMQWWETEFTLYQGVTPWTLYFRDFDIPANWAENAGNKGGKEDPDKYSVTAGPGSTLSIDFDRNTGSLD